MFGIAWNERNGTRLKGRAREDEDDPTRGGDYADIDNA